MSKEPCVPADTPTAEPSPTRRSKRASKQVPIRWDKLKVFDKPALRIPYKLAKYTNGPHQKRGAYVPPPLWVQAAVEAGLAVTELPSEGTHGAMSISLIKDAQPPERMKPLDELLREGLDRTLKELQTLAERKQREE